MASKRFLVNTGLSYPTNPRAKRENWEMVYRPSGSIIDDIPATSQKWVAEQGRAIPLDDLTVERIDLILAAAYVPPVDPDNTDQRVSVLLPDTRAALLKLRAELEADDG